MAELDNINTLRTVDMWLDDIEYEFKGISS